VLAGLALAAGRFGVSVGWRSCESGRQLIALSFNIQQVAPRMASC
jgi:hypothetical protein